jgi:hypothetical protein
MDGTKKIKVSREVVFDEKAVLERSKLFKECRISEEGESEPVEKGEKDVSTPDGRMNQDAAAGEVTVQPRRTPRISKRPQFLLEEANIAEEANVPPKLIRIPDTYDEAMRSDQALEWQRAIKEETASIAKFETWILEDMPEGHQTIKWGWVYDLKLDASGRVIRLKARLVGKGYSQRAGVDFLELYAPVARNESMLLLLGLVAREDLKLYALDVQTAFLIGDLEEEVWMEPPQGAVIGDSEKKCKLNKALYGLKQAARAWHIK